MTARIEVLEAGLSTTVQARGRCGWRAFGVGAAGALDSHSSRIANLLVGNGPDAAMLEIALHGPLLRASVALHVALTGAEIEADFDGVPVPMWRPVDLPAGGQLRLGHCRRGTRAYLAIAGGIDVAPVLGSRATDLRAGFGGLSGRALQARDRISVDALAEDADALRAAPWWVDPSPELDFDLPALARVLPGAQRCTEAAESAWFASGYRVAAASDRVGLRLEGPRLELAAPATGVSEPVAPGTVQLPPDGQPIVLMGECGTVGGYPRIGHVFAADLPRLAQLRPGETLHFVPGTIQQADLAACQWRRRLARIAVAIEAHGGRAARA
ncbi:MAG TPA: biotin-dependent carboxyltransferase family protein [Xanthomonadaceae bacterium]|nr:biotin-dependent carboxyltransferase family protein [Xanthomonadaceae bacterium]